MAPTFSATDTPFSDSTVSTPPATVPMIGARRPGSTRVPVTRPPAATGLTSSSAVSSPS